MEDVARHSSFAQQPLWDDVHQMDWNCSFVAPFAWLISGPASSGKTMVVLEFVKKVRRLMVPPPKRLVIAYRTYQSAYDALRRLIHTELIKGVPEVSRLREGDLLLLDDLMSDVEDCVEFFTVHSHHIPCSVIFLSQNMFANKQRTLSLNAHYLTIFRNPRDNRQIKTLASQLETDSAFVTSAFQQATGDKPHTYLHVNCKQKAQSLFKYRSRIDPVGSPVYVRAEIKERAKQCGEEDIIKMLVEPR